MSRPRTISNEQIIDAARELFLEQGFSVTTAEIARRAGISEGTIFKRWPTKRDLFLATLGLEGQEDPLQDLEGQVGRGTVRDNLLLVTRRMIAFFEQLIPRMMVLCANRTPPPVQSFLHGPDNPHRQLHVRFVDYLSEEMDRGRVRRQDPHVLARIHGAAVWNYVFFTTMNLPVYDAMESEEYAHKLVQALWEGSAPAGQGRAA